MVGARYRITGEIGRGAMGVVYRARHVHGREVAIKVLHDHLLDDPSMVARFQREAALGAKLHHPNLVGVIDVGTMPDGGRMMVLELAPGESLAKLIEDGPVPRERWLSVVEQLLLGLEHAHRAGLIHRDLKPDNVIVDGDTVRIVDFGIAVPRDDDSPRLTAAGVMIGTPTYMAPEQATCGIVDARADLFALGVIGYEMLCGELPFDGTPLEIVYANISQDPPRMADRAPDVAVDPRLEAFVRRLMARRPANRFASARAALDALARLRAPRRRLASPMPTRFLAPCVLLAALVGAGFGDAVAGHGRADAGFAVAQRATGSEPRPVTADALVRRYREVGAALRERRDADDLRVRFRRINLVRALQQPEQRAAALAELDAISAALATR